MSTITLQNFRVGSDLTVKVRLKDGGVAIDWSTLSGIRAVLYSDAQSSIAGRCDVTVDGEDSTLLVCRYAATKMQYLGVNRIVVSAKYMGETKTYDKPAFTFVRWTADQEGEQITIEDPEVTVEISVEDISSSILQEAVSAAFSAADRAEAAAQEAEHMVDIHRGPAGKSPYKGENGNWFEWDEEAGQYVDTGVQAKGETGDTPNISIGTVTTVEPGTPAGATMTGTPEAPVLNLSIPKGVVGDTPNITVGTVTTGEPGTPVVVEITGTAEAPVLNITIPQGMKGDTGVSADYPITIYNGLDSDATDAALSAAQGKVLDGKISQLRQEIGEVSVPFTENKDIALGGTIGATISLTPQSESGWRYAIADCKEGDILTVSGKGGYSTRLWGFIDSDNKLLAVSVASLEASGLKLVAPANASQVIVNSSISASLKLLSCTSAQYKREELREEMYGQIGFLQDELDDLELGLYGGERIAMPDGLKALDWEQDSHARKVAYENRKLVFKVDGVESVTIETAGASISEDSDVWIELDDEFWASEQRLLLRMEYSCDEASFRILYRKDNVSTLGASDVSISGNGVTTFDIKQILKTDNPGSYEHINKITIYRLVQTSTPYGVAEIKTTGFITPVVGDLTEAKNEATEAKNEAKDARAGDLVIDGITNAENILVGGYVRYSDGYIVNTSGWDTTRRVYFIPNVGYSKVSTNAKNNDSVPAAIAFFTWKPGVGVNQQGIYDNAHSVQIGTTGDTVEANVPDGCAYIVVTAQLPNTPVNGYPFVRCYLNASKIKDQSVKRIGRKADNTISGVFDFGNRPCYGHLFIDTIYGTSPAIPCQSLFDVNASARLGMRFIELNVQKTLDNVLIPIHGIQGKFGREVTDLNGDFTYEETAINSVNYSWIAENLRYSSKYAKHRTTIPTLEQALDECKRNGISVMMTYSTDAYALAKKYFNDDFIAYGGHRGDGFTGLIMNYSELTSKEAILELCENTGSPYIHMLNPTAYASFTESQLKELAQAVHDKGCLLGLAGCYQTALEQVAFLEAGGDVLASGEFVNDFPTGNIFNLKGDASFDDFVVTGGSVSNGILTLSQGDTISSPASPSLYLGKGSLRLRFNGKLKIASFGHSKFNNVVLESNGERTKWVSTYFLEQTPVFALEATEQTEIYLVDYKASKV